MLLAPNGKPSNLNAEQYKLVRTPEFKIWFGDWENDPKNASKIVDENGEPLVVYHGAKKKFNVFKKIQQKFDNENYVSGMWFFADPIGNSLTKEDREYFYSEGDAKYMAESWYQNDEGDAIAKVFECFLNVKNPIEANDYNTFLADYKFGYLEKIIKKGEIDGYIIHGSLTDGNVFRDDINVFNSNQIKLADGSNTTFDANNPDIRYAEGGKISSNIEKAKKIVKNELWKIKYLECDGATRVLHYVLTKNNVEHKVMMGSVKLNKNQIIPLHFWLELPDGNVIDYKSRMWLGDDVEEGIFIPEKNTYIGKPISMPVSEMVYMMLTSMEKGGRVTSKHEGSVEFYERTYADGTKQKFTIEEYADIEKNRELAKGIKAEMEHKGTIDKFKRAGVSDKDVATSIAKDHLKEDPKYYTKLMKIQEKLALGGALLEQKFDVGGNLEMSQAETIQPIRQLGTGAKVYFETPFYRVNDNTKDKYVLLVGLFNYGSYMYEYAYYFYNLEIPMFIAKELEKIYPNGVPDAVQIGKVIDTLEKKWAGEEEIERDEDADIEIVEEQPHHGISTNVSDYKNPYEINRGIERLLDAKGGERELYTPDEINFISYYSGYGGLDKMGTFSKEEIKGLLYEFYTPDEVVQKMWGLAYKYGYGAIGDNSVLEPSVGIGAFLKYAPENVYVAANEINKYSAMICEILYPNVQTTLMPFEKNFISKNLSMRKNIDSLKKYSLVIGNPPYGRLGKSAGLYMPMGEDKYTGAVNWAEYFLFRGIDLLQKDGLLIYIIGAEQYNGGNLFLDAALTKTKKAIFEKADLIDAYRMPNKIFERTGVSSEIVIFRKR